MCVCTIRLCQCAAKLTDVATGYNMSLLRTIYLRAKMVEELFYFCAKVVLLGPKRPAELTLVVTRNRAKYSGAWY